MDDLISRQDAIEHLKNRLYETELNSVAKYPYYAEMADNRVDVWMNEVPSAERDYNFNEWCTDCKEYDHERHCCPRFNQVIRTTLQEVQEERKKGTWKREISHYDGSYHLYCSCCGECCGITINKLNREWSFCPNCGADMRGE